MDLINYSRRRLTAVLEEIGRIEDSDFPYHHSKDALALIRDYLKDHLKSLERLRLGKNTTIVMGYCAEALSDLYRYLPLLGFILRSTNIRNAFEVYGPILRLARKILDENTKLILSSEWRLYSPFTYRNIPVLPNYVLIGFPAPESANPLLLPLAGHELGHTVWQLRALAKKYTKQIEETIIAAIEHRVSEYQTLFQNHNLKSGETHSNIFVRQTIAHPTIWALKQAEEYFCDFLGLYLFDRAYLEAFAYLVAPSASGERSTFYPNSKKRVAKLVEASASYKKSTNGSYDVPPGFEELFRDQTEPSNTERVKKFFLILADVASSAISSQLIEEARSIISSVSIQPLATAEKQRVLDAFRFVIPARGSNLSAILNAAWEVFHSDDFWSDVRIESEQSKENILKELVLKNIEVLEIESLTYT